MSPGIASRIIFVLDARDHLERSTRTFLGDPHKDAIELITRGRLE
jgi:hypothetical protein